LPDGSNSITVIETNPAGTPSTPSAPISVVVDTSVPATPVAPTLTDENGAAIAAGSGTADSHPHINGTGTAGDIINVFDNGTQIGSTTVGTDGTWTFQPSSNLGDGTNAITVTETNAAGTSSATSPATSITVDTTVPAKPSVPVLTDDGGLSIPAGSVTPDGHPYISGTGKAGDIITVYDGATAIGSVAVDTDGTWTFKPATDLATGAHSISVTDTNAVGTTGPHSDAVAFTFQQDPVPIETIKGLTVLEIDADGGARNGILNGDTTYSQNLALQGNVRGGTLLPSESVVIYRDGAHLVAETVDR